MAATRKTKLTRRKFLKYGSSGVLGIPLIINSNSGNVFREAADLTCMDIHNHFKATDAAKSVNWERTTDTFKCGDPSKAVRKVAVSWKASWGALREAVTKGADLGIMTDDGYSHVRMGVHANELDFPTIIL